MEIDEKKIIPVHWGAMDWRTVDANKYIFGQGEFIVESGKNGT